MTNRTHGLIICTYAQIIWLSLCDALVYLWRCFCWHILCSITHQKAEKILSEMLQIVELFVMQVSIERYVSPLWYSSCTKGNINYFCGCGRGVGLCYRSCGDYHGCDFAKVCESVETKFYKINITLRVCLTVDLPISIVAILNRILFWSVLAIRIDFTRMLWHAYSLRTTKIISSQIFSHTGNYISNKRVKDNYNIYKKYCRRRRDQNNRSAIAATPETKEVTENGNLLYHFKMVICYNRSWITEEDTCVSMCVCVFVCASYII